MNDGFSSILPSIFALGLVGILALFLTFTRTWAEDGGKHMKSAIRLAVIAVILQGAHFAEELFTGFHQRLPSLFDLPPISYGLFVGFNIAWLGIWSLSVWGLSVRNQVAMFPLWFLSIGCIVNGIAHPVLAVLAGGYFPGLVTSPIAGIVGVMFFRRLHVVTRVDHFSLDTV